MSYRFVALVLVCFGFAACKAKSDKKPATADESAATAAEDLPLSPAQEEAITKDFITRFADAIDADDVNSWPALMTKERAEDYQTKGTLDQAYAAWRRGTATVTDKIRQAPFRLDPGTNTRTLHFEGIMVPNDPETGYAISVRIVDGKMYIDEN